MRSGLRVRGVAFSSEELLAVATGDGGGLILWDVSARTPLGQVRQPAGEHNAFRSVSFSSDGRALASATSFDPFMSRGNLILWNMTTRPPSGETLRAADAFAPVAFAPNGRTLASSLRDGAVLLWDVVGSARLGELRTENARMTEFAFSPDGGLLGSGSDDGSVILWDVIGRKPVGTPLRAHDKRVNGVAFSPDGRLFVSGSADGTVIV